MLPTILKSPRPNRFLIPTKIAYHSFVQPKFIGPESSLEKFNSILPVAT